MIKTIGKISEKAQGMVEFALVLPILLLVILGIIGFGHLFFVYSSTVSASREAARFGAAVGVTQNNIPRYQDCAAIRESAVRLGTFAGVTPDSVTITYDHGPGGDTTGINPPDCPLGGTGPNVELGDRIIVSITVQYQSIVPIVNIPSFPLTAETKRTIVRSLEIGDAPTAEPICPLTVTHLWVNGGEVFGEPSPSTATTSVVGEPVALGISVTSASTNPDTTQSLTLYDSSENAAYANQIFDAPGPGSYSATFWESTPPDLPILVSGEYIGDIVDCFQNSSEVGAPHIVNPADTTLSMAVLPLQVPVGQPMTVGVTLTTVAPGSRTDWTGQTVTVTNQTDNTTCTATVDAFGNGSCVLTMNTLGPNTISASYAGDTGDDAYLDYNPSAAPEQMVNVLEPTLIPTPVNTPVPTVVPTIPGCPTASDITFDGDGQVFYFRITNSRTTNINITRVTVDWPSDPVASLQDIRIDAENRMDDACYVGNPNALCINSATLSAPPPSFTIGDQVGTVRNGTITGSNSRYLGFGFSGDLTSIYGTYRARVWFGGGCTLDVQYDHTR